MRSARPGGGWGGGRDKKASTDGYEGLECQAEEVHGLTRVKGRGQALPRTLNPGSFTHLLWHPTYRVFGTSENSVTQSPGAQGPYCGFRWTENRAI